MRAHTSQTSTLFFFPSFDAPSELLSRRGRTGAAVRFRSALGRLVGRFASAACSFERRPKEAGSVWASARPSLACLSCMRMNVTSSCVVRALPTRETRKGWREAEGRDMHTGVLELVVDALCEGGRQMEPSSAKIISYILGILDIIRSRISDQTTILYTQLQCPQIEAVIYGNLRSSTVLFCG